jgi:hypothetical protein
VNALVAVELSGQLAMAGVPGAVTVLGMACGALIWGYCMEWIGGRSITLGQVIGVDRTAIAASAVVGRSSLPSSRSLPGGHGEICR